MKSQFLEGARPYLKQLVAQLQQTFPYVSVLGTDVTSRRIAVNRATSSISDGNLSECGFVVKMHSGRCFFEYSFDSLDKTPSQLAKQILESVRPDAAVEAGAITCPLPDDAPAKQSFDRQSDFDSYSDARLVAFAEKLRDDTLSMDDGLLNVFVLLSPYEVNKLFISANRELDQHYGWCNGTLMAVYRDGKTVQVREGAYSHLLSDVLQQLPQKREKLLHKAKMLVRATPIKPGVYDIITDSSITGLIAHEAFGHGVEMDQFVKDRALAKAYMHKPVASTVCNMRDGAAATLSAASYFFDDDGVLAQNTQIIKDGILVSGICDVVSACQLGVRPTGNGRRQDFSHKAYTRMTNTFFDAGTSKLEDMIASVKHGYMIFETNNGMEDPKNWQIQCTAEYGIEIVDGKLTENYVSPVVISGSVTELLSSISMVSDCAEVHGSGMCGKGYKEWVPVSDGGPSLKARAKLA